ncbi:tetratricopeptide repeat-containing sensor histidine kinase [Flavobacterium beibuense]|uniref:histidine kinase n=1 Tax=Flavobacterium beibuense TaxID=657326 RepID=A0A444WHS8_9FLAO|nr:tetratricopeptide repeat-containing sensor histidine kinase [Flavobacterium beibuense]RYJ45418.1 putative signal transduction histidine kinase [Flavobacterium beibuense]
MNNYQKIFFFLVFFILVISCKDREEELSIEDNTIHSFFKKADDATDSSIKKVYLDSVMIKVKDYPIEDSLPKFYHRACKGYYNSDFYDDALISGRKSLYLYTKAKDSLNSAEVMYLMGSIFYHGKSERDSAFAYYTQSEKLYQKLHDYDGLGRSKLYKAYIYYNSGEYQLCETEAVRALALLQGKDVIDLYNCHNLIAAALAGQKMYSQAIEYYEFAMRQIESFSKAGYSQEYINYYRASCYNNWGEVYVDMEEYDKAIDLYSNALKLISEKDFASLYAKLLNHLAYAKFKKGDMRDVEANFLKSFKIRDSISNAYGIISSEIKLGEFYAYKKDTVLAVDYLKEAYHNAKELKSGDDILKALDKLALIDKKRSDLYYSNYKAVSDSLQLVAQENRDKFARIEYETDRLQDEKEALVKRNGFIIGVSAMVMLFIGAVFIIYYLNSRNKKLLLEQEHQKANEEIYQLMFEQQNKIDKAREEEKSRIAMELHDGILNNIYAVRLNLEFINRKSDDESVVKRKEYIKQLQTVESEIRSVSHDLSRNAVFQDKSFKDVLESLVMSQKNKFKTAFDVAVDGTINWDDMPNIQKVNVYRIIQEGLQNINKYSVAQNAMVEINKNGNAISIYIKDDGIGFDPEKVKGGIGLRNLRKRTSVLNGKLDILSSPGQGSKIKIVFPN